MNLKLQQKLLFVGSMTASQLPQELGEDKMILDENGIMPLSSYINSEFARVRGEIIIFGPTQA